MSAGFGAVPMYVPSHGSRARATRLLAGTLRKAGATGEHAAMPLETHSSDEARQLKRLLSLGVVRMGRNGGYWLDEQRHREMRHTYYRVVVMILLIEAGVILTLALNLPHHHR